MKRRLALITVATLFAMSAVARAQQDSGAAAIGANASPVLIENGTLMYLELSKSVDAKKAKPGDPVIAVLLADVVSHGRIAFRAESKLLGHVTEAQAHTRDNPESRLGIVFDKIIARHGGEVAFNSSILALRPAPQLHVDSMSPPSPPGTMTTGPQEERHYPVPKGPRAPQMNQTMQAELNKNSKTMEGLTATDIEDLSLGTSADGAGRVVVSYKRTVKLESGIRMDLQITNGNQPNKDAVHAP
jgi:hypothetical protein